MFDIEFGLFFNELCNSEYAFDADCNFDGLGLLNKASAENGDTLVSFLTDDEPLDNELGTEGIPKDAKFM